MSTITQLWFASFNWLRRTLGWLDESATATKNVDDHDHALFKDHTNYQEYRTPHAGYPKIRTFYHPHVHADKLRAIANLPLLVFVHGLGGSLPQFAPLMGSLNNIAASFGIELPGHGLSAFAPTMYEAYSFEALVMLWKTAIERVCEQYGHDTVVLICHSLGCSIAASLVSTGSQMQLSVEVQGVVALCPKSTPPTKAQCVQYRRLLSLPDFVLDIVRWFDRRGDEESVSVKRFVGDGAGIDLKRLQLQFNTQFRTPVWKRTTVGLLPRYGSSERPIGGLPGQPVWKAIKVPLLLIAGEADSVTPAKEAADILEFIQGKVPRRQSGSKQFPLIEQPSVQTSLLADDEQFGIRPTSVESKSQHSAAVKIVTLPRPASHALMYDHASYRTVAGLIEDFLARYVSEQLSLGWQLQQLTTSGKWDVKNLQKWKKVLPVSGPIDGGRFRALKTLREQDEEHTPMVFLQNWSDKIFAIIDISHDSPVYDTKALENGGIQYHKFPTVSKIPPTVTEVVDFIALVDRLQMEIDERFPHRTQPPAIAVHCHYGYNRTGFFIICYLIEKRGYKVQDAIDEFAKAKPPGIKHDHFIDTLYVRYCVGLRRSSTFK